MYANSVPMNGIPPVLHFLAPSDQEDADAVLAAWRRLHPRWDCVRWERDPCVAMAHACYPDLAPLLRGFLDEAQVLRFLRLLLLHRYGGVVVDTRVVPRRCVHSWTLARRLVAAPDPFLWAAAPPRDAEVMAWLGESFVERRAPSLARSMSEARFRTLAN